MTADASKNLNDYSETTQNGMKTVKQYKYVLAAVVAVAVFVMFRAYNPGIFRYDAVKWAGPSASGENIITPEKLQGIGGKILFVTLDKECLVPEMPGTEVLATDPGDLFSGDVIRKIRRNDGPVVLCAGDSSVSARVWMVLSETGIRKLYILRKDPA